MKSQGVRLPWSEVPPEVQAAVADLLGSPVAEAVNQAGGFSNGVAARCRLADGRRCFVKAVGSEPNAIAAGLYRREAEVAAALPPGLPVPAFIGAVDRAEIDGWIAVVFEEVDGRPPPQPWTLDELARAFDALDDLAARTTPCVVPGLPTVEAHLADSLDGFRRLAADPAAAQDALDPWTRAHLDRLAAIEATWADGCRGHSLLHTDVRADNLLVRSDGRYVIVDWPYACTGAPWVDKAALLPSSPVDGGPTPQEVERALDPFAGIDPDAVTAFVVAVAGYFTSRGLEPDPPGLPTVRAFQRAQGDVARRWAADRLAL